VKRISTIVLSAAVALGAAVALAQSNKITTLPTAQPTSSPAGKVEVVEVFMYRCPGCYSLEPFLEAWAEKKPDYVNLVRIPAPWDEIAIIHARAFYTAELLGKLDEMHSDFFTEFHEKRNTLETEAKLVEFFGRYGVSEKDFKDVFKSFAVETKVRRAQELIKLYQIGGTPGIIINGQYKPNMNVIQDYPELFEVVNAKAAELNAGQ
jgi:thiol:disulfide interchange protein DsbA